MLFALAVAAGRRLFWTGNGAFVALIADDGERTRWFGLLRALRNGGFALGGGLAAAAAAVGTPSAYHLLVVGNAASFLLAGLLVARWWRNATTVDSRAPRTAYRGSGARRNRFGFGYRAVLTDHPFMLLVTANFLFVLCGLVVDVLLTVYVTGALHRPAWFASLLFTLNGVLVVAAQTVVTRHTERHRPTRMLQLAAALWASALAVL